MKKVLALALSLLFMLSFAGCDVDTGKEPSNVSGGNVNPTDNSATNTASPTETSEPEVSTKPTDVTIDEQVIYEKNDIIITAKSLNFDSFLGPALKILIENNGDEDICVQTRDLSVNGVMNGSLLSTVVAAGKKANDEIVLLRTQLKDADIQVIKEIEFTIHIYTSNLLSEIDKSDPIIITTSADSSYVQEYDDSGFVAVDTDGIKIVIKKLDDKESFWGAKISVYVENNTDNNIMIQVDDVSINGLMVDPIFSCDVVTGKKAFDEIGFLERDLKDNGITDITDIELVFRIYASDNILDVWESEIVKISFDS